MFWTLERKAELTTERNCGGRAGDEALRDFEEKEERRGERVGGPTGLPTRWRVASTFGPSVDRWSELVGGFERRATLRHAEKERMYWTLRAASDSVGWPFRAFVVTDGSHKRPDVTQGTKARFVL